MHAALDVDLILRIAYKTCRGLADPIRTPLARRHMQSPSALQDSPRFNREAKTHEIAK